MPGFVRTVESYQQGARTLPRDYYTSPRIYAEDRERIFAMHWLCVARADELSEPGGFRTVLLGDDSVLLVRGRDGRVRAFHNVCRHRGTRICDQERGCFSETIQCPYHAWTYALDGRLIGAPHMQEVEGFEKRDYPLHPVALAAWEGFLFVNLSAQPQPFDEAFAPLIGRFTRYDLAAQQTVHRIDYDVAANWKLIFLNYSECLHCPTIHPVLSKRTPYQSGENDLTDGPFLGGSMNITTPGGTMSMTGRACGLRIPGVPEEDRERAYYYTIFPNLLLSLFPDYAMFHTLWPEGPTRTRIICEWLFHPETMRGEGYNPQDAVEFWDVTNREDWHIAERSQQGILSRAYGPGPFSARESLLAAWDREYLRRMGRAPAG